MRNYGVTISEETSSEFVALLSDEPTASDELSDDDSDAGALLLLCGAGSSFLHAASVNAPQQRVSESARVNNFFIQSS